VDERAERYLLSRQLVHDVTILRGRAAESAVEWVDNDVIDGKKIPKRIFWRQTFLSLVRRRRRLRRTREREPAGGRGRTRRAEEQAEEKQ